MAEAGAPSTSSGDRHVREASRADAVTLLVILFGVLTVGRRGASLEACGVASGSGGVGAVSLRPGSYQRIPVRTVRTAWAAVDLRAGMPLLGDRNFAASALLNSRAATGADLLVRCKSGRNLPPVETCR